MKIKKLFPIICIIAFPISLRSSGLTQWVPRIFLFFVLCSSCLLPAANSFSQTWLWAKNPKGVGTSEGYSVSADTSGNVFVTGWFGSPNITFGTIILTQTGGGDVFIAKYDPNGNVLWAKSAGGVTWDEGYSVSADLGGNVFVTGGFYDSSIIFGTTSLTNAGGSGGWSDVFIAKYDANGNVLWAKSAGGTNVDKGYSVSADTSGNVFVTGYFNSSTLTFGTTSLNNAGGTCWGTTCPDIFIAKYDAAGNVLWVQRAGGSRDDIGYSVSANASGNVFLTGYFASPTITFGTTTLMNAGGNDVFIVKYDTDGNALWAQSAAGTNDDEGHSISADMGGNVFVTGEFNSTMITFGTTSLTNIGGKDVFISKYDAYGNVLWAKVGGGIQGDYGYSISADESGNAYVTGGFDDSLWAYGSTPIIFGSTTLIPPAGSVEPMFIVKYDAAGNILCAAALASGGDDQSGVSADPFGNAYVGGDFLANPFIVGSDTFPRIGTEDIFIAKFTCRSVLYATSTSTNPLCNGQCTGTATVNPSGGTSPYTYSWNPAAAGQTTQIATGLCAGNYTVTVRDSTGSTTAAIVSITQSALLTATATVTAVLCNAQCNGNAIVTATGGSPGYAYSWNTSPIQTTVNASGLCAGSYTCAITDVNGCTITQTVIITEPTALTENTTATATTCGKDNGSATANVNGGTAPYTYLWNSASAATAAVTGLASGTYSGAVTDANGCTQTQTITIASSPPGPTVTATSLPAGQAGNVAITQGQSATLTASGGGTYLWSSGSTDTIITVSPAMTTQYCIIVTDANNCTDEACVTVTVEDPCTVAGELYLPNAFSPNADGENDMLKIYSGNINCIKTFELHIYNRWGNNIFETTDPGFKWDGNYKGKMENTAVFVCYMKATLLSGEEINTTGNISLLR